MLARLVRSGAITDDESKVIARTKIDFSQLNYQKAVNMVSLIQQDRDDPDHLANLQKRLSNLSELDNQILVKDQNQDEIHREALRGKISVVESTVKCRKCGQKNVVVYQRQTRSADEPMTSFYTCTIPSCNNNWKV